jgi:hypothetical protein
LKWLPLNSIDIIRSLPIVGQVKIKRISATESERSHVGFG